MIEDNSNQNDNNSNIINEIEINTQQLEFKSDNNEINLTKTEINLTKTENTTTTIGNVISINEISHTTLLNSSENTIKQLEELLTLEDENDQNSRHIPKLATTTLLEEKNNLLNKKEILGVLLVDSFSNFYIQDSMLLTTNSNEDNKLQETISPTTIIGNKYKDNEITSFLVNAFLYLSIPITVLNYLLLTNKKSINNINNNNNSNTPSLSKVSSFSSISSLPQSPNLTSSTSSTNLLQDELSLPSTNTTTKTKENILPIKVDKNIIIELEMLYDHHYSMEIFEYSKKISQLHSDIGEKSKLYFQYLSELTKRSLTICPPKYSDLISSIHSPNQFYSTIRESIEYYLIQNLFHHLFQIDYDLDHQFSKRVESLKFIELSHLGVMNISKSQFNKELCTTLLKLNVYQTPIDKQRCLARTIVKLLKVSSCNGSNNSNEETLLPNLIYLILVSNPPNIYSNYKFLQNYIDSETQNSIYEYSFLLFSMAIQFIEKLDYNHLSIDPLYFQSKLSEYSNTTTTTETTTTTTTTIVSQQFSSLLINDPSTTTINQNEETFNFLTDNENKFKLFKENYRIQNMVEMLNKQINENEIEELLLKFISISLIKENPSYHSLIRYSLKRFFIYYLGIDKSIFLSTEMHTIGALQDDHQASGGNDGNTITTTLDVLPSEDVAVANNNSTNKDKAIKTVKIAGAAVTGAVLVGLSGGMAAPFVFGMLNFVGAGSIVAGITGATGLSGATMLSVIFGAAGAKVSAGAMISATSGVKDFSIHKIKSQTSLHAIIGVYGLCSNSNSGNTCTKNVWDKVIRQVTDDYGDIFIIDWERDVMLKLKALVSEYQGTIVQGVIRSAATNIISQSLASALVPLSVLKAASVLDNPWSLLKDRAEKAGKVLAQQIIDGYFGNRPLTLVSTSMGSRMVFYALEELYEKSTNNPKVYSLIENVVFIGSPITSDQKRWNRILKLVSGRLVNCYSPNDLLLKYVCRSINVLSDGILPAAGVSPIHIPSSSLVIENVDLSNLVKSHLDYEKEEILDKILQHVDINGIEYCLPKISPLYSGKVYDI